VVRAWDFGGGQQQQQRQQTTYNNNTNSGKPMLLAPAMNTFMWEHPLTRSQLDTVKSFAVRAGEREESQQSNSDEDSMIDVVRTIVPQVKTLACGEVGDGALASVDSILTVVKDVCKTIQ
jgi:phosphopantothenoylcysteine decarboxylase